MASGGSSTWFAGCYALFVGTGDGSKRLEILQKRFKEKGGITEKFNVEQMTHVFAASKKAVEDWFGSSTGLLAEMIEIQHFVSVEWITTSLIKEERNSFALSHKSVQAL
ncbi:hypothetical protein R1sor_011118 [Riccia sorocarpa]|uniref:BRCT domain-containing protein n=1 Tax=Riccia sorocarpa TaxID=122646 RepID=A0ABD3I2Q0_9MARC